MMDKSLLRERLQQAIDYLEGFGIRQKDIVQRTDGKIKQSHLSSALHGNNLRLSPLLMGRLADAFPEYLSKQWLLTGEGEMAKKARIEIPTQMLEAYNNLARQIIEGNNPQRPHIPDDKALVAAGFLGTAISDITENECEQYPVLPTLSNYDFSIVVSGNSMTPELHNGDTIFCRWLHEPHFCKDKIYVLDTVDGAVVKCVTLKCGKLYCHSINPEFEDFTLSTSDILRVAEVIGTLRHF